MGVPAMGLQKWSKRHPRNAWINIVDRILEYGDNILTVSFANSKFIQVLSEVGVFSFQGCPSSRPLAALEVVRPCLERIQRLHEWRLEFVGEECRMIVLISNCV